MPHGTLTRLGSSLRFVLVNFSRQPLQHSAPLPHSIVTTVPARHLQNDSLKRAEAGVQPLSLQSEPIEPVHVAPRTGNAELLEPQEIQRTSAKKDVEAGISQETWVKPFASADVATTGQDARTFESLLEPSSNVLHSIINRYSSMKPKCRQSPPHAQLRSPLGKEEQGFLTTNGYHLGDVQLCIRITCNPDLNSALAQLLSAFHGLISPECFFITLEHLLQRKTFTSRSLKAAIQLARYGLSREAYSHSWRMRTSFGLFERLLNIARDVWPAAIIEITSTLLNHLSPRRGLAITEYDYVRLQTLTRRLNKALQLISVPTTLEPYKDAAYQEEAVVMVLQYMAEHVPTLQLDRSGYRAVIAIQLTFGKTMNERRWAQLKALSWPPWKVDRTQLDSAITPEMGITRAGMTLRRMREAGYGPQLWEQTAELYTGWDTDKTPTTQTRVLMKTILFDKSSSALWVARIVTTRTIQEAWAAYLAYEQEAKGKLEQEVLKAIFEKLHLEGQRQATKGVDDETAPSSLHYSKRQGPLPPQPILPGDSRAISPLPPSTHLYTYTRTQPPTLAEFYRDLRAQHIDVGIICLTYLVTNASSLSQGVAYLRDAETTNPHVQHLLTHSSSEDQLNRVPPGLFRAFVQMLCRFPHTPLRDILSWQTTPTLHQLRTLEINRNLALGYAIGLMARSSLWPRVTLNSIFLALSKEMTSKTMASLLHLNKPQRLNLQKSSRACYELVRQLLDIFEGRYHELDKYGFSYLCRVLENSLLAKMESAVLEDAEAQFEVADTALLQPGGRDDAIEHLKGLFEKLTGGCDLRRSTSVCLYNPGPKVWHDLIRVVGLSGDYGGLLAIVEQMCKSDGGLPEAIRRDRNGTKMLQNALAAVRVFLERSWLVDLQSEELSLRENDGKECTSSPSMASAPMELTTKIKELLTNSHELMEWPSDAQVGTYWQSNPRLVRLREMYGNNMQK